MTLAELKAFDAAGAWQRLRPDEQAAIGQAAMQMIAAELVEGAVGTKTERDQAADASALASDQLEAAVQSALPHLGWPDQDTLHRRSLQ